jgi:hypothetical protein
LTEHGSRYSIRVAAVRLSVAAGRGIGVGNTPDVLTDCVAGTAVGLMIVGLDVFADEPNMVEALLSMDNVVVPWSTDAAQPGRLPGVIVNKETGRPLRVMMQSSLERDLALYDRGYQFEKYDLVILTIEDLEETMRTLLVLGEVTVDTYYKYGRVWRVGRRVTEAEIRERLSTLPAVFNGSPIFDLERLERAREAGWFEFKALEYRGRE